MTVFDMLRRVLLLTTLLVVAVSGCSLLGSPQGQVQSVPAVADRFVASGFLTTDYERFRRPAPDKQRRVYENPEASFADYDRIFVDRITVWRDGSRTEPVENVDFQRIVDDLYTILTAELGKTFTLADEAGPGVARLRVALVAVESDDAQLDVFVAHGEPSSRDAAAPLPAGLGEFGRSAWLEAEILDGVSGEPIFAVVDRAADAIPRSGPVETWGDLHAAFTAWGAQASSRLGELKAR